MRRASPPGEGHGFKSDGSNLPWVIDNLRRVSERRYREWVACLCATLPEIEGTRVVEREDDRHRYLAVRHSGGEEIPSWMTSEGTLRFLALTIPAFLPDSRDVYLIEAPENGLHPRAVEALFRSLSSVAEAQVFLATHSPVILNAAAPAQVLCFAKTGEGAVDIACGADHPALSDPKE